MGQMSVKTGRAAGGAKLFLAGVIVLFLVVAGGIGYVVYRQVRSRVSASTLIPDVRPVDHATPTPTPYQGTPPTWDGQERVNILLLGIDEREVEQGPWRTDTMMVLTIDPLTKSAGMLSIPRDLWVPIYGDYGEGRINTANYIGDAYGYPGGGPALAKATVQWNLGVPIHYYIRVNFRGFVEMVNLIGGIDIDVPEEINDPLYPDSGVGFSPLYIPAGMTHMDGELALKYARTRHSEGGDFDRAGRQQQVLLALLDRVTDLGMLPQLLPQIPQIWQTFSQSVQTDLTLDQMIALANLATKVDRSTIRTAVIDEQYTLFWTTPRGEQVLVPVRERIRELRDYLFTSAPPPTTTGDDTAARLAAEAAVVTVDNGTLTVGLARSAGEFLQGQGVSVAEYGNADRSDYTESLVIVYTGKNFTAETITRLLGLPPSAIVQNPDPQAGTDIRVILGTDCQFVPSVTPAPTPAP